MKKLFALILAVIIVMSLASCSIKTTSDSESVKPAETTVKETRIRNSYKDVLPDFKFKNEISENYEESISYSFNVECSEKECEKYIKQLKKSGFVNGATETESYYCGVTDDGYFVEMVYVNGKITVFTKKIS